MPKLRTFLSLDSEDRQATFEAMAGLVGAHARIRFIPPRHWRSRFGSISAGSMDRHDDPPERLATIRRVRLAVARALRNVPGSPTCLPQALAARGMLERRGIESQLYIGTERDAHGTPRFHAWLKVGNEWVTGHCDESRYALLAPGDAEPA
jgi:hypothetical protein